MEQAPVDHDYAVLPRRLEGNGVAAPVYVPHPFDPVRSSLGKR
jgi:hypothetical protein